MTARTKQFRTLEVVSCLTGISMCDGIKIARMCEIAAWLLGAPVWTHELIHEPTMDAIRSEGYRQFPLLPMRDNVQANWQAAARAALAVYGERILVHEGTHGRREGPEETLQAVAPGKPVIVIQTGNSKGE